MKTLNLSYVQFDPNELIKSLHGCNKLTNITLTNVEFKKPIEVGKVFLPALKRFHLTMHHIESNSVTEFMAHLFFYRNYTAQDNTINDMEIVVTSEADGKELRYSDSPPNYLSLTDFNYDVTCSFYYERLTLTRSVVYPSTLRTSDLLSFSIYDDNFHPDVFEVLRSMKHLTFLQIYQIKDSISQPTTVSIDVSIIPTIETINFLEFVNVYVWSSRLIELKYIKTIYMIGVELNLTQIIMPNSGSGVYLDLRNTVLIGSNFNKLVRSIKLSSLILTYWGVVHGMVPAPEPVPVPFRLRFRVNPEPS